MSKINDMVKRLREENAKIDSNSPVEKEGMRDAFSEVILLSKKFDNDDELPFLSMMFTKMSNDPYFMYGEESPNFDSDTYHSGRNKAFEKILAIANDAVEETETEREY